MTIFLIISFLDHEISTSDRREPGIMLKGKV